MNGLRSDGLLSQTNSETNGRPRRNRPSSRATSTVGAMSDNEPGIGDDEVIGARGDRTRRQVNDEPISKVEDGLGEKIVDVFQEFLENFEEDDEADSDRDTYYIAQIHGLREYNLSTLYVDYRHLMAFGGGALATAVLGGYYRFIPYLTRGLHNTIAKYEPQFFREHRQPESGTSQTNSSMHGASQSDKTGTMTLNQQTDKLFTLAFYNLPLISRIRQLRTTSIGKLSSISGTVTRTSEVRPELYLATFTCELCNTVIPNIEQIFRYTEPTQCPNRTCNNRSGWHLDVPQSIFVDWQKVRIQENSSEIPTGSMPRTMDVILRGEIVDRAKAGEKCIFTGTLIAIPDISMLGLPGVKPQAFREDNGVSRGNDALGSGVHGLKDLGVRDLTYRLAFLACMVTPDTSTQGQAATQELNGQADNILASLNQIDNQENAGGEEVQTAYLSTLNDSEIETLKSMVGTDHIYSRLVQSLAPMVYGHEIVKKGLLLQLLGGVHKTTPEGMKLRGDINVCIVGDPSTSKSQFLKYICSFLPRAVYTSGKASSAAGLTAAVVKDEETGEFTIEAGALMLADNGICAIDEFDKMDIADQVAIHEAMEQQTISIAKAGIHATLNARTSILAAANPVGGRYNRRTTLRANINMSAPIMSRFDLFFVILDECKESTDRRLAEHIVGIHRDLDEAVLPEFSTEQLQLYIRFAKTFQPEFSDDAKKLLVKKYQELRANDAQGGIGRNSYRITVRQLESLIRLSEAIAKANCVRDITPNMVLEAYDLLQASIIHVEKEDVEMDDDELFGDADADLLGLNGHDSRGPTPMDDPDFEANLADRLRDELDEDRGRNGSATPAPRQKTKIKYDDYMAILNALVHRVNDDETSTGEGVEEEDLIVWYLEQKEAAGGLQDQNQLEEERALVKKVLKRMVKDNILMQVRGEGLVENAAETSLDGAQRAVYVLHPNCAIEEV